MKNVVPSTGYSPQQIKDLEETLNAVPADVIVAGTPIKLERLVKVNKPIVQVKYDIKIIEGPTIADMINTFLDRAKNKLHF